MERKGNRNGRATNARAIKKEEVQIPAEELFHPKGDWNKPSFLGGFVAIRLSNENDMVRS